MKIKEKYLYSFYGAALIILSISMVWMFFSSGHQLSLHDSTQMKLAAEIFILVLTSVALLSSHKNFIFGQRAMIVLLLLVASVLADIFIELKNGEAENQVVIFIALIILLILNFWILYLLIKNRRQ